MRCRPFPLGVLLASLFLSASAHAASPACEVREADMSFFKDQAKTVSLGTRMRFNKVLLQEKFDVRVVGGVAVLTGNVSSELAIRTAGELAGADEDIRCVKNHLKVGPPLPESNTRPY